MYACKNYVSRYMERIHSVLGIVLYKMPYVIYLITIKNIMLLILMHYIL